MGVDSLSEKFFFGNSRRKLANVFSANPESLRDLTEIVLPKEIYEYSVGKMQKTLQDGRENWATFVAGGDGKLVLRREGQGESIDVKTLNAESLIDLGRNFEILFGEPNSVSFHTHPQFNAQYFRDRGGGSFTTPAGRMTIEQYVEVMNIIARHFSDGDLGVIEKYPRAILSSLLVTSVGIRFVLNARGGLPLLTSHKNTQVYQRGFRDLYIGLLRKSIQEQDLERDRYDEQVDRLLLNYCKALGYVAFGNNDFSSPRLKRLG